MVATLLQLPLLNQIWDPLLSMKDAVVLSPHYWAHPGTPENVIVPHSVGVAQAHYINR